MSGWGQDGRSWGDVAAKRNGEDISDYRQGNPAWREPRFQKKGAWDAPGHTGMFHDDDGESVDDPKRSFTTKKRHGWWGKEERYDMRGRRID